MAQKLTYPGIKQINRIFDKNGMLKEDILVLDEEPEVPNSKSLLIPIIKEGKIIYVMPKIDEIRQYYLKNMETLPKGYKVLEENHLFKLKISKKLESLTESLKGKFD